MGSQPARILEPRAALDAPPVRFSMDPRSPHCGLLLPLIGDISSVEAVVVPATLLEMMRTPVPAVRAAPARLGMSIALGPAAHGGGVGDAWRRCRKCSLAEAR